MNNLLRIFSQKIIYNDRISRHIIWLSLVHGSITSAFSIVNIINDEFNWPGDIPLTLRINQLKCNPSLLLTKCVLSELFSWVGALTTYIIMLLLYLHECNYAAY